MINSKFLPLLAALIAVLSTYSCSHYSDSCKDLEGRVTHTTTELTGIDSITVVKHDPNSGELTAIDEINGANFSNISIEIIFTWIEEEHRFREENTYIQSALGWLISSAYACTLAGYYEEFQPEITGIEVYSDSDFNDEYLAGENMSDIFTVSGSGSGLSVYEVTERGQLFTAKSYSLKPLWRSGELASTPEAPQIHTFTVFVTLADGRVYEVRSAAVLITSV